MITLRLFHRGDPSRQLDQRILGEGELVIGRDLEAGWTIDDPSLSLSRRHCTVGVRDGRLTVVDTSSNGVYLEKSRTRLACGVATPILTGEALRLGEYILLADGTEDDHSTPLAKAAAETEAAPRAATGPEPVPTNPIASNPRSDGALLEAFCHGAGLDASSLSSVDPVAVMGQAGRIYREMVRGLRELMNERVSAKSDFLMDGTTVRAQGNNPFRWAPAQKVAIDMLRARDGGFLTGAEAVKASFDDVKDHLTCTVAGMRGAVASILSDLDPNAVERRVDGRRPLLRNRVSAAWAEYVDLYGELKTMADDDPDGLLQPRFRAAYEDKAHQLDALAADGCAPFERARRRS